MESESTYSQTRREQEGKSLKLPSFSPSKHSMQCNISIGFNWESVGFYLRPYNTGFEMSIFLSTTLDSKLPAGLFIFKYDLARD